MTLRPRRSFTVTIFIAVTRVFSLALSLAILGFPVAGERAAVATAPRRGGRNRLGPDQRACRAADGADPRDRRCRHSPARAGRRRGAVGRAACLDALPARLHRPRRAEHQRADGGRQCRRARPVAGVPRRLPARPAPDAARARPPVQRSRHPARLPGRRAGRDPRPCWRRGLDDAAGCGRPAAARGLGRLCQMLDGRPVGPRAVLAHLRALGRTKAEAFLAAHFDDIG